MKVTLLCASSIALGLASASGPALLEARAKSSGSATATSSGSLPTITTKGNAFFVGDDRFYIRGIDYQPGGASDATDPLADYSTCSRDIPEFQKLGLNTIRVYTVDNSANHDQCMNALAAAGIYLALDVNNALYSINRGNPASSYNPSYLQSVFATIDSFAGYSNTLLFFSGNEVVNAPDTTQTAPFVKAVTRDMKQYLGERNYRQIPVGYSAAAVAENQYLMAQYMDCGDDPSRSDFYAINNYGWCDPASASFESSGWSALVTQYSNYSLPLFFSEYGCITGDRNFAETSALYQPDMTSQFSGGLIYEYSSEDNGYGIVTISGDTVTPVGSQFSDFQNALSSTQDPSGGGNYSTTGVVQTCPDQQNNWDTSPFTGSALPALPSGAEQYMQNGAGLGPGLKGSGSQDAEGGSSATASAGAGAVSTTYGSGAPSATGATASASSSGAAISMTQGPVDVATWVCGGVMLICMMFGTMLI